MKKLRTILAAVALAVAGLCFSSCVTTEDDLEYLPYAWYKIDIDCTAKPNDVKLIINNNGGGKQTNDLEIGDVSSGKVVTFEFDDDADSKDAAKKDKDYEGKKTAEANHLLVYVYAKTTIAAYCWDNPTNTVLAGGWPGTILTKIEE